MSKNETTVLLKKQIMEHILNELGDEPNGSALDVTDIHTLFGVDKKESKRLLKSLEKDGKLNFYEIQMDTTSWYVDLDGNIEATIGGTV